MSNPISKRKPHNDFSGYVAELRNVYSGGHTIILDCKRAAAEGAALVEDYKLEGGRYQVLCNEHSFIVHCTALPDARGCMKDPTAFCSECRILAGESTREGEGLAFVADPPAARWRDTSQGAARPLKTGRVLPRPAADL